MRERRCFVQFMHPGGEHQPDQADRKRWNRGPHRRKFLKSRGRYLERGQVNEGEIAFWGEWEPESCVLHRYTDGGPDAPRFLYEPYYVEPRDGAWRQNTDPFVFGTAFHYTGCMQHTKRGPTQLRLLERGSIILFGSCRGKRRFVLDTAFVIADSADHNAADHQKRLDGRISDTYRAVTIDPWYRATLPQGRSHRLYWGATRERPVCGMFSFFPCQRFAEGARGFERPEIQLPGFVTPSLTQGKIITRDVALADLADLWGHVAGQVERQALALGIHAELPPRRGETLDRAEDPDFVRRC